MPLPPAVMELIQRFDDNAPHYRAPTYNETETRREFIDPLFSALGWDVDNKQGYSEKYKEVVHEARVQVGGRVKAPDYAFRIGGRPVFFVEAKRPGIVLHAGREADEAAFQVRRYAWSAKLPVSVLTNFQEIAIYDCRSKPARSEGAGIGRLRYLTYQQYAERWDDLTGLLAAEAIRKGALDRFIESEKATRGTLAVDAAFLAEIEVWRDILARNFALRNGNLTVRQLNFAVQKTIDRIIFLRIAEDRGFEPYHRLGDLAQGKDLYRALGEVFRQADNRYNAGLFYFRHEGGREEDYDDFTLNLALDDKALKEILTGLYYPDSPYAFDALPADILGQVYEQFLGKVIRLTAGGHAKVEEKPEVKKAGGVYYTPTYIVDYIVEHTVGQLLEGKTWREVRGLDARGVQRSAPLRLLDPACGSGTFLLQAYQTLLDWYLEQYTRGDCAAHAKGDCAAHAKAGRISALADGGWRLTTEARKDILLTHIHGVDIDPQAVEVTKLSLLLKVLEGENEQSLGTQLVMSLREQERVLPDLGQNIRCGNSLIGPDYYQGQQLGLGLSDEEALYRINAFDWSRGFPQAMAAGGFDAVIGNPPYVRQELLGEQKTYFRTHYRTYQGTADLYVYFIELGVKLLKPGGLFSYIVANKWMRANYGTPLRQWLTQQCIEEIIDFGDLPVFQTATTYPCIMRLRKDAPRETFDAVQADTLDFTDLSDYARSHRYPVNQRAMSEDIWSLADTRTQALLTKLQQTGVALNAYVHGKIYRGVLTGYNEAFVIDAETRDQLVAQDPRSAELIRPFLAGRDVKRYQPLQEVSFLVLMPKGWTAQQSDGAKNAWKWLEEHYPAIASHLAPFEEQARKRYDQGDYWWELRACDYYSEFEQPKIVVPAIVKTASYAYDESGFFSNDKTSIVVKDDLYLLGLLNSKVLDFVLHSIASTKRGGYFEYKPMYVASLPIRTIAFDDPADVARHHRVVALVEAMLELHRRLAAAQLPQEKRLLQQQIEAVDKAIDALVYELYGLTAEEIALVEGAG